MPLPDDEFAGKKLILISSDPTPSLSDIFEIPLSANEQQIEGVKNLYTLEIQSEVILEKWKARFAPEIHQVLMAFSKLDYDFVK